MSSGARPKIYDPALVEVVRQRYVAEGMSQAEVARSLGVSQKVVWNVMRRHGLAARPAKSRQGQRGPLNPNWRSAGAGYQAKHLRVERLRGAPSRCDRCGDDDPNRVYDWANLTGDYDDPNDYERMCRSCHRRFDNEKG